MSSNEFLNYLDTVTSPERKLIYQQAIETLMKSGNRDVEYYIDQTMQQDDIDSVGDFLNDIEQLLNGACHAIILNFGVVLSDETPLRFSTDILKGLLALDNWDDKATISQTCDQIDSAESILADLLQLVGAYHSTEYAHYLTRVSSDLIDRIDLVNQVFDASGLPSEEERNRARQRIQRFFGIAHAPILSQAIREMLLFGADYHALMEPYHDAISALPMEEAIRELVGFALVSNLTDEALGTAIIEQAQGWWDTNALDPVKASGQIQKLLEGVRA